MHRVDTPSRQKDKFGAGRDGFTNGDPQTGTQATEVPASWLDAVQEELSGVIEMSGLSLNKSENNQLYQAIERLLDTVIPIGVVLPWVGETPPNDRFVIVKNQTFDKAALPKLAKVFPSGLIPFDPRGSALRWWDAGRGVDSGRLLLSEQSGAVEYHNHVIPTSAAESSTSKIWGIMDQYWHQASEPNWAPTNGAIAVTGSYSLDSYPGAIPGNYASETRMRNVALCPIMRVK